MFSCLEGQLILEEDLEAQKGRTFKTNKLTVIYSFGIILYINI